MLAEVSLPVGWGATSHHVDLAGVGDVHYVDFGGPDGGDAPIVLVHGLGGSYVNWVALGPLLASRRRVLALDLPGFGRSEPNGRSARVVSNAAALAAFIDHVAGEPPLVMGNSMGGMLSIIYASTHPVTGVVLIDPVLPRTPGQPMDREIARAFIAYALPGIGARLLARARTRLTSQALVDQIMSVVSADPANIPQDLLDASVELAGARGGVPGIDRAYLQAARSLMRLGVRAKSYRGMMRAICAPVLMIHGTQDRLVPVEAARAAATHLPDWAYVEMPHAGHVPHMEAARDVEKIVSEWMEATGAA